LVPSVAQEPSPSEAELVLRHELAVMQQRLASCQAELVQVHAAAQDAQAQGSSREQQLRSDLAEVRRQRTEREAELVQACTKAETARDQAVNREQQTRQDQTTEQAELQRRLAESRATIDELQKQCDHQVAQMEAMRNQVNALEAAQQKWTEQRQQWSHTEAELRRQIAQATDRNTALTAQVRTLEQDKAASGQVWLEQLDGMYQRIVYLQQRLWLVAGLPREATKEASSKPNADAVGTQTMGSNPLIPFARKVLEHLELVSLPAVRKTLTEHNDSLLYIGVLIAQAQLVALLVPSWGPHVGKKPNQLARCVVHIVRANPELYPLPLPDWAEQQEELLVLLASKCKEILRLQLLQTSWHL
jgi:hypothetical protein